MTFTNIYNMKSPNAVTLDTVRARTLESFFRNIIEGLPTRKDESLTKLKSQPALPNFTQCIIHLAICVATIPPRTNVHYFFSVCTLVVHSQG